MTKRIEYIDAIRGTTMILVVYSHIAYWCLGNIHLGYNDIFINFRMPLFFFISGWLFYKADHNWNKESITMMMKKKFQVQISPFLFFLILYLYLIEPTKNATSLEDKFGYWFTFTLFEYFAIYIFAELLFNKERTTKGELTVFAILLILSISAFYYDIMQFSTIIGEWRRPLALISFAKLKYIFFFGLGTETKKHFDYFRSLTNNAYIITIIIGVFFIMTILSFPSNNIYSRYIIFLITGTCGILIIFTFFRKHEATLTKDNKIGSFLQYIGTRTLDIYLLHYFFLPYNMNEVGLWLTQHNNKAIEVFVCLTLAIWVIIICLLVSNLVRLSPTLGHYLFGAKLVENLQNKH